MNFQLFEITPLKKPIFFHALLEYFQFLIEIAGQIVGLCE